MNTEARDGDRVEYPNNHLEKIEERFANLLKHRKPHFNIFLVNDGDKPLSRELRDIFGELIREIQQDKEFENTNFHIHCFEDDDEAPNIDPDVIIRFTFGPASETPPLAFDYDPRILFYAIPVLNDVRLETPTYLGSELFEWEGVVSKVMLQKKLKFLLIMLLDAIVILDLLTGYKPNRF